MANDLVTPVTAALPVVDREVDPVSRIEGHLGVKVRVDDTGKIVDANAHGNLWRGFENFLLGRAANDAITFVQRICGVCPVPHGLTSTYAVDSVLGYSRSHITFSTLNEPASTYGIPPKAVLIRNLVLSAEFLMSSITHFYHLAAPSYVQGPNMPPWTPYFADAYYSPVLLSSSSGAPAGPTKGVVPVADGTERIWDAVIISYVRALKIRRLTFEAGALFAGRMPMTSCFVGGGVTNDGTEDLTARCNKYEEIIREVGLFIINEYVPIALVLGFLYPGFDNGYNGPTSYFYNEANDGTCGYGAGLGRFLVWGQFPELNDDLAIKGGVLEIGAAPGVMNFTVANKAEVISKFLSGPLSVPLNLTEDISHSRYDVYGDDSAAYAASATRPFAGPDAAYPGDVTRTKPKREDGYTYMKAPRWAGKPCEVGPMADMFVNQYFQDNVALATTIPGYTDVYLNADGDLDTRVLAGTIVNGILNSGNALLGAGGGATLVGLLQDWIIGLKAGLSTMDRLRARALQSLILVQRMVGSVSKNQATGALAYANDGWIHQLKSYTGAGVNANDTAGSTWANKPIPIGVKKGWGAGQAPRGSLMHQMTISNGKITAYQCIVPTTWNGSPKDAAGQNGAIEASCIGAPFATGAAYTKTISKQDGSGTIDTVGGVEVTRIAQSFDPCIACAIH